MAEIVNLNKFRKAKARAEKEKRAETNRVLHGTPKALKDQTDANQKLIDKKLSGKKLDQDDDENDPNRG